MRWKIAVYGFGVGLAATAFLTGSISPDGPRTRIGEVLLPIYMPYFGFWCGLFGEAGILLGVVLAESHCC